MNSRISTLLLLMVLSLIIIPAYGQLDTDFTRLKCEGEIPPYFKTLLYEDIQKDKKELSKTGTKLNKKNAAEFVAITNFGIQKYIRSGKVLYGDPLTNYANGILDKLKEASDEDIDDVQLFTLKSSEVNAFAVHQGYIFITTGLWGHLENEAQLAHIIGHELQHIISNHSLEKFEFVKDQISFGQVTKDELSKQYKYSRDAEFEADSAGFLLAKKAGYHDSLLCSSMNMLASSHRPIQEHKIDYSIFEDAYFKLPSALKLIRTEKVMSRWELNAENSTHPNVKSRFDKLVLLSDSLAEHSSHQDSLFLICRELAQAETLNAYIVSGNYVDGLYHNMVLLDKYPENSYLQKSYAMMWYAQAAENSTERGTRYSSDFRYTSGELERFYFMFYNMNKAEMSAMAVREIWKSSLASPKDSFLIDLRRKALLEFVRHKENDLAKFKTSDVMDRLKKERRKIEADFSTSICALLDNMFFINEINAAYRENTQREKDNEVYMYTRNVISDTKPEGKLLLAKPLYSKQDLRKNVVKNLTNNESTELEMIEIAEKAAQDNHMDLAFFGNTSDVNFQTSDYNDVSIMYDYLQENIKHPEYDFLPFNSQYLKDINGIDSIGSLGFVSIQSISFNKRFSGAGAFFSALSVVGFPTYLRWQTEPKQYSFLVTQIYDLNTHNLSLRYMKFCNTPLNVQLESAQLYNALNQTNSKR